MGLLTGKMSFASLLYSMMGIINMLVTVLAAAALVFFFVGLVRYVKDAGDAKGHTEGRERIIWSLIALFILFSIWGIINILSVTFFGSTNLNQGGSYAPTYQYNPQTYPAM